MDGSVNKPTKKYVDHTYRDFSRFLISGGELRKCKRAGNNFPAKLHRILSDDRNNDVITWLPHGRAFQILKREELVSRVIPNYFDCRKYVSFTRQLNAWGFKRLYQNGPNCRSFYHECFLRDMPELTPMIALVPPNQGKHAPNPDGEPNFDDITRRYPVPPVELEEEEVPGVPAVLHQVELDDHSKSWTESSASKRRDLPPKNQRMSQSRSLNPQATYPSFEYSRPTYHPASSQHGRYHDHPAPSAQSHGYIHDRHYPGYYYPPAPPPPQSPPPPRDELQMHSVAAFEDEKWWARCPPPPLSLLSTSSNRDKQRAMNEQNTNNGLGQDTGDPYAPIPHAEQSRHGGSSDQGASLPDDSLEQVSRLFLGTTESEMHDEESVGRDSYSAGGAGKSKIQVSKSEDTAEQVSRMFL